MPFFAFPLIRGCGPPLTFSVRRQGPSSLKPFEGGCMPFDRREFLHLAAGGAAASALLSTLVAQAVTQPQFKAIAFDAFPIFDPRPVFGLAETLFPGKGAELSNAWRTRQFEYQWLRALSGHYADFWHTTED